MFKKLKEKLKYGPLVWQLGVALSAIGLIFLLVYPVVSYFISTAVFIMFIEKLRYDRNQANEKMILYKVKYDLMTQVMKTSDIPLFYFDVLDAMTLDNFIGDKTQVMKVDKVVNIKSLTEARFGIKAHKDIEYLNQFSNIKPAKNIDDKLENIFGKVFKNNK